MIASASAVPMRPNILVVDDRRENLLASAKILKHLDAGILTATSGNEALSLLLRHKCAVVLLDVQMPEMDGFEMATLMQEHELMRPIPIIFVTAISKEEKYAAHAATLGAVDYVFKPVNAEILKSKVKVYLDLYVQKEQIMELNKGLQQSNEELERFAYICSHDMREPLRMINSYVWLLGDQYAPVIDDKGKKYFNFITSSAQHMQRMIDDILKFSRVGREEVQFEPVDCGQVARDILDEFHGVIQETKAEVILGDLPEVETSPTLVRLLFQNLVGNALKFQDGSKVPQLRIDAKRAGADHRGAWQFCVTDNGIGIDAKFQDKVFTVFQRIHRKEEYPGTGIGLSTCKKFIELCGGAIWYDSELGRGTSFFFTLPQNPHGGL